MLLVTSHTIHLFNTWQKATTATTVIAARTKKETTANKERKKKRKEIHNRWSVSICERDFPIVHGITRSIYKYNISRVSLATFFLLNGSLGCIRRQDSSLRRLLLAVFISLAYGWLLSENYYLSIYYNSIYFTINWKANQHNRDRSWRAIDFNLDWTVIQIEIYIFDGWFEALYNYI